MNPYREPYEPDTNDRRSVEESYSIVYQCENCEHIGRGIVRSCGPQHRPDWGGFQYVRCGAQYCGHWNRLKWCPELVSVLSMKRGVR